MHPIYEGYTTISVRTAEEEAKQTLSLTPATWYSYDDLTVKTLALNLSLPVAMLQPR